MKTRPAPDHAKPFTLKPSLSLSFSYPWKIGWCSGWSSRQRSAISTKFLQYLFVKNFFSGEVDKHIFCEIYTFFSSFRGENKSYVYEIIVLQYKNGRPRDVGALRHGISKNPSEFISINQYQSTPIKTNQHQSAIKKQQSASISIFHYVPVLQNQTRNHR